MSEGQSTNPKVVDAVRKMLLSAADLKSDFIDLDWFDGAITGVFVRDSVKVGEHEFERFEESDDVWKLIYWRIRWNNSPVGSWDATSVGWSEPIQVEQFDRDQFGDLILRLWLRPRTPNKSVEEIP